jgi:hypothetical protein
VDDDVGHDKRKPIGTHGVRAGFWKAESLRDGANTVVFNVNVGGVELVLHMK